MQAAGLAKDTFYMHFEALGALEAELGEALTDELDQPCLCGCITGMPSDGAVARPDRLPSVSRSCSLGAASG